jgi:hypothetical protein
MKKKIIGIFVVLLMITTALPVSGTLQENEQKNIVLNQTNKTELLPELNMNPGFIMGIGFFTNLTDLGGAFSFNAVFFLIIQNEIPSHRIRLLHFHESYIVYTGGRIENFGEHFGFFLHQY